MADPKKRDLVTKASQMADVTCTMIEKANAMTPHNPSSHWRTHGRHKFGNFADFGDSWHQQVGSVPKFIIVDMAVLGRRGLVFCATGRSLQC